jgi:hypothetical protein
MTEGVEGARLKQQLAAAERFEHNQRPQIAPLVEAWDVAGWTEQAGRVGGDFYDWFVRPDEQLALALGDCSAQGIEAALTASSLRAGLRSHAEYVPEPGKLLERINRSLWTSSAGDQSAGLFFAVADPATGRLRYASAGHLAGLVLSARDCPAILIPTPLLGLIPETHYETCERLLEPGDALLIASEGVCEALEERGIRFGDERFGKLLLPHFGESAADLAARIRDQLEACAPLARYDRTILVVKHLAPHELAYPQSDCLSSFFKNFSFLSKKNVVHRRRPDRLSVPRPRFTPGAAMSIRLHAEPTASGVVLSKIKTAEDAQSLCVFIREHGQPATVTPDSVPGDFRVLLLGLEWDRFETLIDGANVDLV